MCARTFTAALAATLLAVSAASACQCPLPSPGSTIDSARYILAAQVERKVGVATYVVRVLASWRGNFADTLVVRSSPVCGYPMVVGDRYLIYIGEYEVKRMEIQMCSGTRPFDYAYTDRYLLGEPETLHDVAIRAITVDDLFEVLGQSEETTTVFGRVQIDPTNVLPRLEAIALGLVPGNRVAALEAISSYGKTGQPSYSVLRSIFDNRKNDPSLRAGALRGMLSVTRDFGIVQRDVSSSFRAREPELRIAAIQCSDLSDQVLGDYADVMRRERVRCLSDRVADVRYQALWSCCYREDDRKIRERIQRMATRDPDPRIRRDAQRCVERAIE